MQKIRDCVPGVELIERGYETDVTLASELDVSSSVPILSDKAYVNLVRLDHAYFGDASPKSEGMAVKTSHFPADWYSMFSKPKTRPISYTYNLLTIYVTIAA